MSSAPRRNAGDPVAQPEVEAAPAPDQAIAQDAGVVKHRTSPLGDAGIRMALMGVKLVARLPYPVLSAVGKLVGSLAWWVAAKRRRVTMINLRLCWPDMSEAQRRALGHEHFRYFVRSFFDRFVLWFGSDQRIRNLVRLQGMEHYEPHRGKPVIFLAPHFCGIDASGTRFVMDQPLTSMYANQKSRFLTEVMTSGRTRFPGARMFLRNDGLRPAIRAIRDGVPFYFLPDMDLGPRDAVFVPFFGIPAATVTSVARLAGITRAAVIPLVTRMTPDGYVGTMYPAWEDFPGDDITEATRRMNAFIEARVREMPAQYLWSHKRFKTRPPGEAGFYGDR